MMHDLLLRYSHILVTTVATCLGAIGVFALVCSALHPHPDAALMAIVFLVGATALTMAQKCS
jgi:hypothetical protein